MSKQNSHGLSPEQLNTIREQIQSHILTKAENYFTETGTAYTQNNPALKKGEMVVNFYDYQPCCASVLGKLAAQGNERALTIIRRLFNNVRYYIGEGREKEGFTVSLRRSQLHLVLCYEHLKPVLDATETETWADLLRQSGEDMFDHFERLQERVPALDNRGFGTGINHVAIAAEGIWKSGEVLDRPEWCDIAGAFIDRLIAYGHPDGYFEEHTNDEREGGPSLVYTPFTAGCSYIVQRWRNAVDHDRFAKCGTLFRQFLDTHRHAMPFADERANPHGIGSYGVALHSLTPQGRSLLHDHFSELNLESGSLESLARLDVEIDHIETGDGATPEPYVEGTFRITPPLGVARSHDWTMGLSAMKALNREISPHGDYALDRQTLLFLSHPKAGTIISGAKSKRDPSWSTVRKGDDAYPIHPGNLILQSDRATAKVFYETFSVNVTWIYGDSPRLILNSDSTEPLTTQLVLEAPIGTPFTLNQNESHTFGEDQDPIAIDNVATVATDQWRIDANAPGRLIWYVAPFNPYSEGNLSAPNTRRPVFAVDWTNEVEFIFSATQ